jgi:peptidoglycan/xylan/chitin deacetylase (PgdA/CDA1 family)
MRKHERGPERRNITRRSKNETMPLRLLLALLGLLALQTLLATHAFAASAGASPPRPANATAGTRPAATGLRVPVLVYHRFGPSKVDAMTVRTSTFQAQLRTLREDGWTVVALRDLIAALDDPRRTLPAKSVAITVDDGHLSVYTQMYPSVRESGIPITLFIYPSAISNASYAMTWQQLDVLRRSRQFVVQSHAYWHPNFAQERKRMTAAQFQSFLDRQLADARRTLQRQGAGEVEMLAWPFGIQDDALGRAARAAGYTAAFGIQRRPVRRGDPRFALPRYIVTDEDTGPRFLQLLNGTPAP